MLPMEGKGAAEQSRVLRPDQVVLLGYANTPELTRTLEDWYSGGRRNMMPTSLENPDSVGK